MKSRTVLVLAALLGWAACCLAAPPAENAAVLKRQMQEFERVLNNALQQMFENRPFAVLQEPKSAYLPGFGLIVHAEVNLYPMRMVMPFSPAPYSETELKLERTQKLQRLKQLQDRLRELLLAESASLGQVSAEENVAVIIHLYNPRPYPEIPGQIVVQARRQALLELQGEGRKPAPAELAKVIALREF